MKCEWCGREFQNGYRYCCKRCQQKAEEYNASQKRKTKEKVEMNKERRHSFLDAIKPW